MILSKSLFHFTTRALSSTFSPIVGAVYWHLLKNSFTNFFSARILKTSSVFYRIQLINIGIEWNWIAINWIIQSHCDNKQRNIFYCLLTSTKIEFAIHICFVILLYAHSNVAYLYLFILLVFQKNEKKLHDWWRMMQVKLNCYSFIILPFRTFIW